MPRKRDGSRTSGGWVGATRPGDFFQRDMEHAKMLDAENSACDVLNNMICRFDIRPEDLLDLYRNIPRKEFMP